MLIGFGSCFGLLKIKIKCYRWFCLYYVNIVVIFYVVFDVSDLVFKFNLGLENNRIVMIIFLCFFMNYWCWFEVKGVNYENLRFLKCVNDEFKKYIFNRLFIVCFINVRFVCNKILIIKDLIVDYKIDLMGIIEIWFWVDGSDVIFGEFCLNGYCFVYLFRLLGIGGGVGILFKLFFCIKIRILDYLFNLFECLDMIFVGYKLFRVIVIYCFLDCIMLIFFFEEFFSLFEEIMLCY